MSKENIDKFCGQYAFLSNFYEAPVRIFGHRFKNSEAAFQAAKCPEHMDKFCNLNPSEAKRLGRNVKIRPDWEDIKYRVMWAVCFAKFLRNTDLQERLLNTENAHLVEGNTWGDTTWGVCNGKGQNWLGSVLESVRDVFRTFHFSRDKTYLVTDIYNKRPTSNPVHDTVLLRPAYVRDAIPGESAEIMFLPAYDTQYHQLCTSTVRSVTPYDNWEDTVIIETRNSKYTLQLV